MFAQNMLYFIFLIWQLWGTRRFEAVQVVTLETRRRCLYGDPGTFILHDKLQSNRGQEADGKKQMVE